MKRWSAALLCLTGCGARSELALLIAPAGPPRVTSVAFCGLRDFAAVLQLLTEARRRLGPTLSAFEVMWPNFYELITAHAPGVRTPLAGRHGRYVLLESQGATVTPWTPPDAQAALNLFYGIMTADGGKGFKEIIGSNKLDPRIADLAGAMGKRTVVMLPYSACFRWGADREDSEWYPNMRLFRQAKPGQWTDVIAAVAQLSFAQPAA